MCKHSSNLLNFRQIQITVLHPKKFRICDLLVNTPPKNQKHELFIPSKYFTLGDHDNIQSFTHNRRKFLSSGFQALITTTEETTNQVLLNDHYENPLLMF
ncbi:unnamed protein product [Heterobilharzia americana]|nr:unnamed protein product [Heterobilharzia americana]